MLTAIPIQVDWLALILATFASFALGAFWYSPKVFGGKWAQGVVIDLTSEDAGRHAAKALSTQFVGVLLLAFVLGWLVGYELWPMVAAVVTSVAFFVASAGFFHRNSLYSIVVESAFVYAMSVIMIVVHVLI